MVGDRHQLPAVGRGGVLDLAARWAAPESRLTLDTVHRFVRTETTTDGSRITVPDEDYAQLSLAMRDATDPAAVFDELVHRDLIQVHASDADRVNELARTAVDARCRTGGLGRTVVIADTRDQVAQLNAAIRDRLVDAGMVDDSSATSTGAGQRIGCGDRVVTRRNDTALAVANRDAWVVTGVANDGSLTVRGDLGERVLPAGYVREHVELAYASTVHGIQGDTATAAHAAIDTHSSAASTYVAMTRGRENNVAHLVADDIDQAREQWVSAFAYDRADLGPAHAAELAEREATRYAQHRPLEQALTELRDAWTIEANAQGRLEDATHRRDMLRDIVTITEQRDATLPALQRAHDHARAAASAADTWLNRLEPAITQAATELADTLQAEWDAQRQPAREAAQTVRHGTGRLGQRRAAVREAHAHLDQWAADWQPYLPAIPATHDEVVAFAAWFDDTPRHHQTLATFARAHVEAEHPDYLTARRTAENAQEDKSASWHELRDTEQHYNMALQHYGNLAYIDDPADRLAREDAAIATDTTTLNSARHRVAALLREPTLRAQPRETLDLARADWTAARESRASWLAARATTDRTTSAIDPGGRGVGGVLENLHERPGRGIGR